MIDIELTGEQKKSIDTLKALSANLQQKGVLSALHVAARPLIIAMRANAPDDPATGGSRLAVAVNKTRAKPGRKIATGRGYRVVKSEAEEIALLVGPNKKVTGKYVGYIGWFLEQGAKAHRIGKGQHPGIAPRRWMSRSLESSESMIKTGFYTGLEKWIAKNGR
jgi:hypothetical protein